MEMPNLTFLWVKNLAGLKGNGVTGDWASGNSGSLKNKGVGSPNSYALPVTGFRI